MSAKTFSDLIETLDEYAEQCYDNEAESGTFEFYPDSVSYMPDIGNVPMLTQLSDHAFGQINGRLHGPDLRWLRGTKVDADLRARIMNLLVEDRESKNLLVRQNHSGIRAIMSDQYTPFDNAPFVRLVQEAVDTMGVEAQIHRPQTGDILRAWILLPSITFAKDPITEAPRINGVDGDVFDLDRLGGNGNGPGNGGLHPAVYITNSEIGTGSVRATGGVYRSVCTNGLIYGWRSEESMQVRHRFLSMNTMRAVVAAGVADAFRMSEKAARTFVEAQEIHVQPQSLRPIVDEWTRKYGLTVEASDNWLASIQAETFTYNRKDDPRLFDVVNGATYAAQNTHEDEREVMERMAGDMLEHGLPRRHLHAEAELAELRVS